MATPSQAQLRAFVRSNTRLRPVPDVPGVRLHLSDDAMEICRRSGIVLGRSDPPLPFWAFAWTGGLAVARHLADHPDEIAGRRVLDLGAGSGLCAITAALGGADEVDAVDIDPLSEAAVALNARANRVRIGFRRGDILDDLPPAHDLILAGDVCYEEAMAERAVAWLRLAAARGTRVLIGDPGRAYLPHGLVPVATYRVRTTREIEDTEVKGSTVYTL